jgi:hypothetical protein
MNMNKLVLGVLGDILKTCLKLICTFNIAVNEINVKIETHIK